MDLKDAASVLKTFDACMGRFHTVDVIEEVHHQSLRPHCADSEGACRHAYKVERSDHQRFFHCGVRSFRGKWILRFQQGGLELMRQALGASGSVYSQAVAEATRKRDSLDNEAGRSVIQAKNAVTEAENATDIEEGQAKADEVSDAEEAVQQSQENLDAANEALDAKLQEQEEETDEGAEQIADEVVDRVTESNPGFVFFFSVSTAPGGLKNMGGRF